MSPKRFRLKICGQEWEVRCAPREIVRLASDSASGDCEIYGVTDGHRRTILVDERLTGWAYEDTVVHELIHAVHFTVGIAGRDTDWAAATEEEERYVRLVTPGVLTLLRGLPAKWRR